MTGSENREAVAVIGSGGIGGYLAAVLVEAGRDVTLCVRTAFDTLTIEEAGQSRAVPVRIATDPAGVSPVRFILLTTKAQDTESAAPWIRALAGPQTVLVVVQNGIGHEERAGPIAGPARILPSIINCSVERVAPGRIVHHGARRLEVPKGADGASVVKLFADTPFEVVETEDFKTVAWRKLLANLVANAITALTIRRTEVFGVPAIHELAEAVLAEALAVARADGAKLSQADADRSVAGMGRHGGSAGTSMLYDRLAGRPLEHRHITGALVAAADRHAIPVPVNRTLLALLEAVSGQKLDAVA